MRSSSVRPTPSEKPARRVDERLPGLVALNVRFAECLPPRVESELCRLADGVVDPVDDRGVVVLRVLHHVQPEVIWVGAILLELRRGHPYAEASPRATD